MQLYKSRGFGEFFQDTFAFIKQNGSHFFKYFFIINGIFIMILMVLSHYFSKFYSDLLFSSIVTDNQSAFENFMNENFGIFIILCFVFVVVGLLASIISYAFVPIYLKLYNELGARNFQTNELIKAYKKHFGQLIIFVLCGILIAIPIAIFVGLLAFVLAITIIGLLALPIVAGIVSLFYQGSLMEYLERKRGLWESFGYNWKLMSSKFWASVGSVGLFFLISYIIQYAIALIPSLSYFMDVITESQSGTFNTFEPDPFSSTLTIAYFIISFIITSVLNAIVQMNQGIIFYSLKEDNEHINTKSDIDLIGTSE
ncbi:hypothetical protein [Psychroserpens sp.]|uniref:hypothetical protein n=1 Tax=Psychroserpens sp. TaxID=2020870 RepID=UPI001B06F078|nr:hypothetical protein [Psychroserpens sp.]MBO6607123.1 hypothetical protein [Psychroserpens sp.]MBO6630394.1 hypothetical protein [Psychroserpens sp.]MBO6654269.1 hypothetical protein [Psychroserpens sp.]MBO6682445.1 hypothetical protein [Psychroserpens sp.]MBO6750895.1 hypothetical protein [Psychroserpens sp.]